jgi:excisionase family DNA binding protein
MPQIMTTKEIAKYLKLHEITICKYAAQGRIPAIRIGRVWRFDKDAIDKWIGEGTPAVNKVGSKEAGKGAKK